MKLGDEGQGSLAGCATPEPVSVGSGRGWGPERPACLWVPARWPGRLGLAPEDAKPPPSLSGRARPSGRSAGPLC